MFFSNEEKKKIILNHFLKPKNNEEVLDPIWCRIDVAQDSCTDHYVETVLLQDNLIKKFKYTGQGCIISKAALSILSELVEGKTTEEAQEIINQFKKMMNGEEYNATILGEGVVFENVRTQPSRIRCVLMGSNALEKILKNKECKKTGDKNNE